MGTATFSGSYGHNMTLELRAERSGKPNIAGNSSNVHVTGYLHTNGYASMWGVTSDATITINGGSAIEHPAINIGTNSTQKIFDHTYTIGHNNDGTKTVGIKLSVGLNVGGYGSAMVAFDFRLPDIPRASSVSDVTGTLGSAMTININRKVSSFTHTVKYYFGNLSGTIATGAGASVSWTPPLNLATQIPSASSGWGNITVDTYNGSTKIGSATCRLTLNVPESMKPTFTGVTLSDTNTVVSNIITTANTFVEILSNVKVAFSGATGIQGSTITGHRAEMVGENQTVTSDGGVFGLVKKSGEVTIRSSVQDSRGRWSDTKDTTVEFLEYTGPTALFIAERSGSARTTLTVTRTARISPLTVGDKQLNQMTVTFKTRPMGGDTWTTNNGSASGVWTTQSELIASPANLAGTFSGTQSWEVMMTVSDLFTTASYSYPVSTDTVLESKTKDGIGIGKIREHGALDVAGEIYANNKPIQHHQLTDVNGTAIKLNDGTDLNNVTACGFYNGNNLLHAPTGNGANVWMYIHVTKHTYGGWTLQEAIDFNGVVSAFRMQKGGSWDAWQYYAVQNKVANFTAVNQTKVYSKTITMPYTSKATLTRIGNQVQITWLRAISNINRECEYTAMAETIPLGYRPAFEVHMSLNGNVSNSVNAWAVLHLQTDGSIKLTNAFKGNHVWTGTTTYLTTDPFPAE
ncbi:capsid and scaffold protein [Streptococcus phage Javan284]|uniref:Prophage LambdaSa1, minor structural protein, putative n=1 Tax=Streptococcus lutetiensis 033 TaxID=1076934 RepID=A0AB33AMS2_9STRE|nr:DUF859 family phage minor structural protein [Streptococcus lutetiensis]AGS05864.1 prophage LambdaSa1, minor structural protein, putative [Streptococcus lutetiensis 033]QBX25960.1 capsid and scaffold protein [Streptococcus phage Javan284]